MSERIKRGLEARERQARITIPLISKNGLHDLHKAALDAVEQSEKRLSLVEADIAKAITTIDADEDQATTLETRPDGTKVRMSGQERAVLKKAFDKKRADIERAFSQELLAEITERQKFVREALHQVNDSPLADTNAQLDLWASTNSTEVAQKLSVFRELGSEGLMTVARSSLTSGDKAGAVAVSLLVKNMKVKERPFNPSVVAEEVFKEDLATVRSQIAELETSQHRLQRIEQQARGGTGALKSMEIGLADREMAEDGSLLEPEAA